MNRAVTSYLNLKPKLDNIHGWCLPEALATWDALLEYQASRKIIGNCLEIGVWKGKTAFLLQHHLNEEIEKLFLIDIHLQREELQKSLKQATNIVFHESPSWGLAHLDFPSNSCKWIHIDGKHTGEAVYNDLIAADKLLSITGIVCIDDFFEHQYPQITQAVFRYLDRNPYSFAMFLCGFKKAYLARIEYVEHYLNFCHESMLSELEMRNAQVTLSKTTHLADFNCFSLVPRYAGLQLRGPDWDKEHLEVNKQFHIKADKVF